MQHLVEAVRLREFFQAPPILRAALGARQLLLDFSKFQFAGTDCLRLVGTLFFHSSRRFGVITGLLPGDTVAFTNVGLQPRGLKPALNSFHSCAGLKTGASTAN